MTVLAKMVNACKLIWPIYGRPAKPASLVKFDNGARQCRENRVRSCPLGVNGTTIKKCGEALIEAKRFAVPWLALSKNVP
jgi:hypothetical protein